MKKFPVFVLIISLILVSGCIFPVRSTKIIGSGEAESESRRLSGFSKVDLSGIGTLIIEQGTSESLEITADENILEYLTSDVSGSTLNLGVRDFVSIDPKTDIIYHLSVKDLEKIETSGLGIVEIDSMDTTDLEIEISGSGNFTIKEFIAESLDIEVSGMGNINLAGSVEKQRIRLSGTGKYIAGNLKSSYTKIDISGSGEAEVWVIDELEADLSGVGSLRYYGSPVVSTEISGIGTLNSLGGK
jgi:hypothetical protein